MEPHLIPAFEAGNALAAVMIAVVYITAFSLVKEPNRQIINALIIAAAGGVYWSGGLGVWEYPFGPIMLWVAFRGLKDYRFIGIGWLLHTVWDIVHHLYANPIVAFSPSSSAGCAVCDSLLAIWFFFKAPSVLDVFKNKIVST